MTAASTTPGDYVLVPQHASSLAAAHPAASASTSGTHAEQDQAGTTLVGGEGVSSHLSGRSCSFCHRPLTDPLTGVLDRYSWEISASEALTFERQRRQPVALILADLDQFKTVNDSYGHLAGDSVLRGTAAELLRIDGAIVGRYGGYAGDEFLMLLPRITLDDAIAIARQVQERIGKLTLRARLDRSTEVSIRGQTVSLGVAASTPEDERASSLADLILDSDVALRTAKRHGGNQIRSCTAASR